MSFSDCSNRYILYTFNFVPTGPTQKGSSCKHRIGKNSYYVDLYSSNSVCYWYFAISVEYWIQSCKYFTFLTNSSVLVFKLRFLSMITPKNFDCFYQIIFFSLILSFYL